MSTEIVSLQVLTTQERSLIAYVELSLRRHAYKWRGSMRRKAQRELLLLNRSSQGKDGDSVELAELIPGGPPAEEEYLRRAPLDQVLSNPHLYEAFQQLPDHYQHTLLELILLGVHQQSLANRYAISQQAVCKRKQEALRRLRVAIRRC